MIPTLVVKARFEDTPAALCAQASACGASAIALVLDPQRGLTYSTSVEECLRLREALAGLENGISTVFASLAAESHFGSTEAAGRNVAFDRVLAAVERAAWVGARVLVVESAAVVGGGCTYAAALNGTHLAFQRLRFVAQRHGIDLALAAPGTRFLLSPVELRNLLDEQHDPGIGAALDVPACLAIGNPVDWIGCLGRRLSCILLSNKDLQSEAIASTLVSEVCTALREAAFDGPVCSADPTTIRLLAAAQPDLGNPGLRHRT